MAVSVHFINILLIFASEIKTKKLKDYEDFKRNERIG